jgi:hypothetical protein
LESECQLIGVFFLFFYFGVYIEKQVIGARVGAAFFSL